MKEIIIIGSGFSAFCANLLLQKFDPLVISYHSKKTNLQLVRRKNLDVNKIFSYYSKSFGNFKYKLNSKTTLHDRLSVGGNSNIWGGFIDISNVPNTFINILTNNHIKFTKLDFYKNGYMSNLDSVRQLRNINDEILDTQFFFKNLENGFVNTVANKKDYILTSYYSQKNQKIVNIKSKKVLLAINLPQLIDLLYRSKIIDKNFIITLSEFDHKFVKNFNSSLKNYKDKNDFIVKYDFLRTLKHFSGYKKNLDKFRLPLPLFVDQIFSKNLKIKNLKLDIYKKIISEKNSNSKFGDSIHYCDLHFDKIEANKILQNYSTNLIGVSSPFVKQLKPGPISNDIINNILKNINF